MSGYVCGNLSHDNGNWSMCYLGTGHSSLINCRCRSCLASLCKAPTVTVVRSILQVCKVSFMQTCNDCMWPVQSCSVIQFTFPFVSTLICVTIDNGNTTLIALSSKYVTSLSCFI